MIKASRTRIQTAHGHDFLLLLSDIFLETLSSAAIMIEAIYELTRAKMKETEIDGVPRTKNQVCYHL